MAAHSADMTMEFINVDGLGELNQANSRGILL